MQLYTGRPADQWRGFAALHAGNSVEPATWHHPAGYNAACQYQHRSDDDRDADAEYVSLRRERDDGSGNAWHDEPGQRHGRCGNRGRIAYIALGLLTGKKLASWRPCVKWPLSGAATDGPRRANPKTLFNGAAGSSRLCFSGAAHRACPPEAVSRWPQSGRRTPRLMPPNKTRRRCPALLRKILGICRPLTLWLWS